MKRIAAFFAALLCAAVMLPACPAETPCMTAQAAVSNFSEQTVYQALIALKSQYPEGMKYDNSTPYSADRPYVWEAARQRCAGCAAFAAVLSDTVFGVSMPVQEYQNVREARPGDVLRYTLSTGGHSVIVLRVLSDGVEVAEGNYGGTVHWGRTVSFSELQNGKDNHFYTRYPQQNGAVRGDANGSGDVSADDAQMVLASYTKQVAGKSTGLSEAQFSRADADRNGRLSVEDAQLILIYYTRNIVSKQNVPWEQLLR